MYYAVKNTNFIITNEFCFHTEHSRRKPDQLLAEFINHYNIFFTDYQFLKVAGTASFYS